MRLLMMVLLGIPLLLLARENPFVPVIITEVKASPEKIEPQNGPKIHPQRPQENLTQKMPVESSTSLPAIESGDTEAVESALKSDTEQELDRRVIVNYDQARFVLKENSAYIETKDEVLRHFAIKNPPSIVIDFKGSADFYSKRRELAVPPFIKLEMGAHHDHYRVVLRLDKKHKYKIETKRYGQVVTILD